MDTAHSAKALTLESMTGFAAAQGEVDGWSWTMDIRSVNGRGLDLRLRMPDWITGLEPEIRKRIQSVVTRGTVTMNLRVQRDGVSGDVAINAEGLAHALATIHRIEQAAAATSLTLAATRASDIATMRGVLEGADAAPEATTELKSAILADAETALTAFVEDRRREGAALHRIVSGQIDQIETLVAAARAAVGDRAEAAREAMRRALDRLKEADIPDEARLSQELALIAVKTDISEELDRLDAHIAAARDLLEGEGARGRKLDFLIQEFNREANTLCSKSQSTELTAVGLDLKTVIDQMREQVQNIA